MIKMKYLESFDLFGGGEYEKMTRSRFMAEMDKMGSVDLSEEQRIKLSKLLQGSSVELRWRPRIDGRFLLPTDRHPHEDLFFCQRTEDKCFFIFPFDDDWYFIEIFNKQTIRGEYYKCDGIEGIKKMLSDNDEVFREI